MKERVTGHRNLAQTPMNPNCLLCHYSGYSNLCTFFRGGECPYSKAGKAVTRDKAENK